MNLSRLLRLAIPLGAFAVAASAGTSLLSLNPPYIQAGGPGVTLNIGGSGFVPGGTVILGGASLATTYIDSTKISAVLPASLSALSAATRYTFATPTALFPAPSTSISSRC